MLFLNSLFFLLSLQHQADLLQIPRDKVTPCSPFIFPRQCGNVSCSMCDGICSLKSKLLVCQWQQIYSDQNLLLPFQGITKSCPFIFPYTSHFIVLQYPSIYLIHKIKVKCFYRNFCQILKSVIANNVDPSNSIVLFAAVLFSFVLISLKFSYLTSMI